MSKTLKESQGWRKQLKKMTQDGRKKTIKKTQTEGVLEVKNKGRCYGLQDDAVKFRLTL